MSYININEVDKTLENIKPASSDDIAYVPLNSTDGPTGKYVVVSDYSDFTQTYGIDPEPNGSMMTSWDFAANLLLRNMPVMVRRVTNVVDDDGYDTDKELPGVSTASRIIKVPAVTGTNIQSSNQNSKAIEYIVPAGKTYKRSDSVMENGKRYSVYVSTGVDADSMAITAGVSGEVRDSQGELLDRSFTGTFGTVDLIGNGQPSYITYSRDLTPPYSGIIEVKNTTLAESHWPIKIFGINVETIDPTNGQTMIAESLKITESGNALINDVNVVFKDEAGKLVQFASMTVHEQKEEVPAYIELPVGWSILFNENVGTSKIIIDCMADAGNESNPGHANQLTVTTLKSPRGEYSTSFTSIPKDTSLDSAFVVVGTCKYAVAADSDDADNMQAFDEAGNINLFNAEYRYSGSGGNALSVGLRTIDGDGIYLQVWNGKQRIENIKLASFRYVNKNGIYANYDLTGDMDILWKQLLSNFGIPSTWGVIDPEKDRAAQIAEWQKDVIGDASTNTRGTLIIEDLTTTYLKITLNKNLLLADCTYLYSVYQQNGTSKQRLTGGADPANADVIHEVPKTYAALTDKYLYDVKFITNGGYVDEVTMPAKLTEVPQLKRRYIEDSMLAAAQSRGDCTAFIDLPFDLDGEDAVEYFQHLSTSYGTAYMPWCRLKLATGTQKWCPPSFVALWDIAKTAYNTGNSFMPPAGVNRGLVNECTALSWQVPSDYIDYWQDNTTQFINPIIYINGYGVCIFGQRTLYNGISNTTDTTSALQYLNVRLVANEIKRKIFKTCLELTFEYNTLKTWLLFKTRVSVLLESLLRNQHISNYEVVMDETTMTSADVRNNHIVGIVRVAISNLAEKFDITFELQPNQVTFLTKDNSSSTDAYGNAE